MKMKSMLMGVAATSANLGGMAFQSSSVQAISLKNGDTISIGGNLRFDETSPGVFNLFFDSPATQNVDGLASSTPPFVAGDSVFLANLAGLSAGSSIGPVMPFITDINLDDGVNTAIATFDLLSASITQSGDDLDLNVSGQFSNGNTILGRGTFTTQLLANAPVVDGLRTATFSAGLTVVPTPAAVLPALVGMGTAAFRKKKRDGEEELAHADAKQA